MGGCCSKTREPLAITQPKLTSLRHNKAFSGDPLGNDNKDLSALMFIHFLNECHDTPL